MSLIGGRYERRESLGEGGFGEVHRAWDTQESTFVALKQLKHLDGNSILRFRREIAALQELEHPGIVVLLDEGEHHGRPFYVSRIVEGGWFPGTETPMSWDRLGGLVTALLESLAAVHDAGIIHRDLKPANVLVHDGRPVLLDFGLARGKPLGPTITDTGAMMGTPQYEAPEQLLGERVDARADLYAVGVMVFEALAGRRPQLGESPQVFLTRVMEDAPPLAALAPHTPPAVCRVVDRLLQRRRERRPPSAREVLRELASGGAPRGLPFLGSRQSVEALLNAVELRRTATVLGPRGSGRSRVLKEVSARLEHDGHTIVRTQTGSRPFESLSAFVPEGVDSTAKVEEHVTARVREAVAGGVMVVDDLEQIDRWSRKIVDAMAAQGAVLASSTGDVLGDVVRVRLLTAEDLSVLFCGPDRLLHLQTDAATLLAERSGGLPQAIADEVGAWLAAGLASWDDERLSISRASLWELAGRPSTYARGEAPPEMEPALEDLVAWIGLAWPHATPPLLCTLTGQASFEIELQLEELVVLGAIRPRSDGAFEPTCAAVALDRWSSDAVIQARGAIADELTLGSAGRLTQLILGGRLSDVEREALQRAYHLFVEGRLDSAVGTLLTASHVAQPRPTSALIEQLVVYALYEASPQSFERAMERAAALEREDLATLVRASAAGLKHDPASLDMAESIPAFEPPELEAARHGARFRAAMNCRFESVPDVLESCRTWFERQSVDLVARYRGFWAHYLQRSNRFLEAGELHLEAAQNRVSKVHSLTARANASMCLRDGHALERAVALADQVREEAAEQRLPIPEAIGEWIWRSTRYRQGVHLEPDEALVAAAEQLGDDGTAASIAFTEAVFCMRDRDPRAESFALRARRTHLAMGIPVAPALSGAIANYCLERDLVPTDLLLAELSAPYLPRLRAQAYALMVLRDPQMRPVIEPHLQELQRQLEGEPRDVRLELMTLGEAEAILTISGDGCLDADDVGTHPF